MDRSDEVASIINSMLPEYVQEQQRAIAKESLERRLAAERQRIKQSFDQRIEEEARSINEEMGSKIASKKQSVLEARRLLEKARLGQTEVVPSESEKRRFIDETIREIATSGGLSDIRQGIMNNVWTDLQKHYESKMTDELEDIRRNLQAAYNERKKAKKQYYSESIQRTIKDRVDKLQQQYADLQEQRESIKTRLEECRVARQTARTNHKQMADRFTQLIGRLRDDISAAR